ncbi:DUF5777 family beta-barrel protein [Ferruginibacter sp.]
MQKFFLLVSILAANSLFAQEDTAVSKLMNSMDEKPPTGTPTKVFYSQKLINANTVEVLHKGILEFKVVHNFGDASGSNGGIRTFFGLDGATDVKIAFQAGLTDKLNVFLSRTKGGGNVTQLIETGIKYQFLKQMDNDPKHPISLTLFANMVVSTAKSDTNTSAAQLKIKENHFENFSDRLSQVVQLMIARKFGKISLQLNPTYVHTNYVVTNDQKSMFALGGGVRLPVTKKFVLVADYFHAFRSKASEAALKKQYAGLYDASRYDVFGIGVEIVTPGHMFHLNFTNSTNILENRFIPRTFTTWGKGQYRWGFTIARNFVLFRDKKKK